MLDFPGAVVLGHSYGGVVITHAARGLDVSHLVYLAALMPDEGEDVAGTVERVPGTELRDAMRVQEDGLVSIDPAKAVAVFYDDCEPEAAKEAVSRLRPQRLAGHPVLDGPPPWRTVPSTYVVCRDDRALAPALQRELGKRAARLVEWDGAHSPFLAQPQRVMDLLENLAE